MRNSFTKFAFSMALGVMFGAAFALPAHADASKMAQYVGNYKVKSCDFQIEGTDQPADFYCRAKSFLLQGQAGSNARFTLTYVDELGQTQNDVVMSQFQDTLKDGTAESGAFDTDNSDPTATWTYSAQKQDNSFQDIESRAFTANQDGTVQYQYSLQYISGDTYKNYTWTFTLQKM